jgi:hypothetical protein
LELLSLKVETNGNEVVSPFNRQLKLRRWNGFCVMDGSQVHMVRAAS